MITDDMLWDYADGFLDKDDRLRVEASLRQHPDQQARLEAIKAEKRAFAALPLEKPDAGFAQDLLAVWMAEQSPVKMELSKKSKGPDWILWCIAAAFGLMMLLPLLVTPVVPSGRTFQLPEKYMPELQIPAFDWPGFFSSIWLQNVLLLALAMMSLKILDKYLQVKDLRLSGQ